MRKTKKKKEGTRKKTSRFKIRHGLDLRQIFMSMPRDGSRVGGMAVTLRFYQDKLSKIRSSDRIRIKYVSNSCCLITKKIL